MYEEIKSLLIELANLNEENISLDATLKEDLGIDSIYAVEMILELEEHYNIKIDVDEMNALKTVKDVVDLVSLKVGE